MQHEYIYIFSKYLKILADFWSLLLNHVDTIPTTDVLFYATKRQDNGSTWNSLNNLNEALNFVQFPSLSFSLTSCHPRESRLFSVLVVSDCIHIAWSSVHFEKNHNDREQKRFQKNFALPFCFYRFLNNTHAFVEDRKILYVDNTFNLKIIKHLIFSFNHTKN